MSRRLVALLLACAFIFASGEPILARHHHHHHTADRASAGPDATPPATCAPAVNDRFADAVAQRRTMLEAVQICGIVSGRPTESSGAHGLHAYIPVRVRASNGASFITQIIPNENLIGRVAVREGDAISALGQFVYPNRRPGYEGLLHDTHRATHAGAANGFVVVNGTVYR